MKTKNFLITLIVEQIGMSCSKKNISDALQDGQFAAKIGATQAETETASDLVHDPKFDICDYLQEKPTAIQIAAYVSKQRTDQTHTL